MSALHLLVCGAKGSFAKSDNGLKTPDEDSLANGRRGEALLSLIYMFNILCSITLSLDNQQTINRVLTLQRLVIPVANLKPLV